MLKIEACSCKFTQVIVHLMLAVQTFASPVDLISKLPEEPIDPPNGCDGDDEDSDDDSDDDDNDDDDDGVMMMLVMI